MKDKCEVCDLQAELDATNRQVEILSDALAESRREIDAMIALARTDEREACAKMVEELNEIGHSYGLENRIRARGNT
jgi:predicted  nucleic acid-binding Zn-ribbon protein